MKLETDCINYTMKWSNDDIRCFRYQPETCDFYLQVSDKRWEVSDKRWEGGYKWVRVARIKEDSPSPDYEVWYVIFDDVPSTPRAFLSLQLALDFAALEACRYHADLTQQFSNLRQLVQKYGVN